MRYFSEIRFFDSGTEYVDVTRNVEILSPRKRRYANYAHNFRVISYITRSIWNFPFPSLFCINFNYLVLEVHTHIFRFGSQAVGIYHILGNYYWLRSGAWRSGI